MERVPGPEFKPYTFTQPNLNSISPTEESKKAAVSDDESMVAGFENLLVPDFAEFGIDESKFISQNPDYVLSIYVEKDGAYKKLFDDNSLYFSEVISSFISANPEGFLQAMIGFLDFENPDAFKKAGQVLALINNEYVDLVLDEDENLYEGMDEASIDQRTEGSQALKTALEYAIANKSGNYLLIKKAERVYTNLFGHESIEVDDLANDFFPLTADQLALAQANGIWLVPQKSYETIKVSIHHDSGEVEVANQDLPVLKDGVLLDSELLKSKFNIEADDSQLEDFLFLIEDLRIDIEDNFDFDLTDLTITEQFYFLNYLKHTSVARSKTVKQFTSLYGIDGMRTFLSLERGDETLGDSIVAFGQHDEVAGTVFRYYSDLLNSANRAEQLVREVSNCEGNTCIDLANQVRANILNRAQKDLEKAVRAHDPSEVAAQIENYVATAKEYVALLQEVGAGRIEIVPAEALSEEDKLRMQELLHKNFAKAYPESKDADFKAAVAGSLLKSFKNPNTTFRVLRDRGQIVSFNRFDTLRDYTGKGVSYFGSFNADSAYSGVGGIMLEETIKDQLENGHPMMAHCDPTQAITKKYIEDGFVATGFYPLAGKPSFEIWRSQDSSQQLESKNKTIEELVALEGVSGAIIVREQNPVENYPELQAGLGLTRYFTHDGKTYIVFERLADSLQDEFTPPKEDQKQAA